MLLRLRGGGGITEMTAQRAVAGFMSQGGTRRRLRAAVLCAALAAAGLLLALPVVAAQQALTASIEAAPDSHDGSSSFEVRIRFSERLKNGRLGEKVVRVANGDNTASSRVEGTGEVWKITIEPDGDADVIITLVAGDNDQCASGLACTTDLRPLSAVLEHTVPGRFDLNGHRADDHNHHDNDNNDYDDGTAADAADGEHRGRS